MVNRIHKILKTQSFFLFGARGVGKSTLLKQLFANDNDALFIDLLDPKTEDQFRVRPETLSEMIAAQNPSWVIIDEVQKLPKLLDLVHLHIERDHQLFALSGSSARKLRRGSANMLAGRALVNNLHPLSAEELGEAFNLHHALTWGLLPQVTTTPDEETKMAFLDTYSLVYIKEEIVAEQIVRKLDPFRLFLPIAAQMSGKPLNFTKIARDIGVDTTTIQNYFSILEDTLIGFSLPAYHRSIRKRQRQASKFYLFDNGVMRSLTGLIDQPIKKQTSAYGIYFEHFIIQEIRKRLSYYKKRWEMSYLLTKDDVEIDLILEKTNQPPFLIEIKSTNQITPDTIASFSKITSDFGLSTAICLSNDPTPKVVNGIQCFHWKDGIKHLIDQL